MSSLKQLVCCPVWLAMLVLVVSCRRDEPRAAGAAAGRSAEAPRLDQRTGSQTEPKVGAEADRTVSPAETIARYDAVVASFYGEDPREALAAKVSDAARAVNEWGSSQSASLKGAQERVNVQVKTINELGTRIAELHRQLKEMKKESMTAAEVGAYNTVAGKVKELVAQQKALVETQSKAAEQLRTAVAAFEKEREARATQFDALKATAQKQMKAYADWHNGDAGSAFFRQVNTLYAALYVETQRRGTPLDTDPALQSLRSLRRQLGDYARQREDKRENGLIIVAATLGDDEGSTFIVDTGASVTTISPALARVLGLDGKGGPEMAVTLAGGIKLKGPEVILPRLTVFGKTAEQVKAVVIDSPMPGVDGLLGHTFLAKFDYKIDRTHDPKLTLTSRGMK